MYTVSQIIAYEDFIYRLCDISCMLFIFIWIFQIYSEFVQVSESLHHEKSENERLNSYLDEILEVSFFNVSSDL